MHRNLEDKRDDGINLRRSVMQETYAALAIIALQKKVGKPDQLSEDEFYAQFCEAPWQRLARFSRALLDRTGSRKPIAPTVTADHYDCRLAKA